MTGDNRVFGLMLGIACCMGGWPSQDGRQGGAKVTEAWVSEQAAVDWRQQRYQLRSITFMCHQPADGGRYPTHTKETYVLTLPSTVQYTAYFGGLPLEVNHVDAVTWEAGAEGEAVIALVRELLADRATASQLRKERDTPQLGQPGDHVYLVGLRRRDGDEIFAVRAGDTDVYRRLQGAFAKVVEAFQHQTGRPRVPSALPQGSRP